jgi:hypothetical protein
MLCSRKGSKTLKLSSRKGSKTRVRVSHLSSIPPQNIDLKEINILSWDIGSGQTGILRSNNNSLKYCFYCIYIFYVKPNIMQIVMREATAEQR